MIEHIAIVERRPRLTNRLVRASLAVTGGPHRIRYEWLPLSDVVQDNGVQVDGVQGTESKRQETLLWPGFDSFDAVILRCENANDLQSNAIEDVFHIIRIRPTDVPPLMVIADVVPETEFRLRELGVISILPAHAPCDLIRQNLQIVARIPCSPTSAD